jgi:hypothetical protein
MRRDWLSAARVRGRGCSVLDDGLRQAICGRIDPLIDVSLMSNVQSTLFPAPVKGRGSNSASLGETGNGTALARSPVGGGC